MLKNKKINITFFSANRAEYGLIYPFIKKISNNKKFNVNLIVAGSHLEKKFGIMVLKHSCLNGVLALNFLKNTI